MSTILVVDDDFAILEGLSLLLEGEGFRVRKASDGAEGLARLAEEAADLVVSDVMMPVMTGPAMVARMAAEPRLAKIPVILLTATIGMKRPVHPQVLAVLPKPFLLDQLLAAIHRALAESGARNNR